MNLTSVLERMGTSDEITVNTMGEISFLTCIVIATHTDYDIKIKSEQIVTMLEQIFDQIKTNMWR